jgi:hypothetical protein
VREVASGRHHDITIASVCLSPHILTINIAFV